MPEVDLVNPKAQQSLQATGAQFVMGEGRVRRAWSEAPERSGWEQGVARG